MKAPWANIALLFILITLTVTGYLGLVSGEENQAWRLWLHGIAAYALIVLFVWKGAIILDAFRRKNKWTKPRIIFAVLLACLILTVILGLLWTLNGPLYLGGFSLVSLHIYIAVPVMVVMVYHAWKQRFIFRVKGSLSRRLFIGTGITAVLGLLFWRTAETVQGLVGSPGSERRFTGSYEKGSFGGRFPVVSWINDNPPPIDLSSWRLEIKGAVQKNLTFTYDQIQHLPQNQREAVLDCTGGWYTQQIWEGIALEDLLDQAGLDSNAASVTIFSVTGYKRRFPLSFAAEMLLATQVAGQPLSHGHGAPLRLVVPGERGMEWVKWVTEIEVNNTSDQLQSPLPLS